MKKKIYYVVEKELVDVDGIEETNGIKTINLYEVQKDEVVEFKGLAVIHSTTDVPSLDAIEEAFIDNNLEFDLKKLKFTEL